MKNYFHIILNDERLNECFPLKIRYKVRISIFTISAQHHTKDPIQGNKAGKVSERHKDKKGSKTVCMHIYYNCLH